MAASDTVEVSREHLENAITELQEVIASDAETSMTDVETVTEDELEWCDDPDEEDEADADEEPLGENAPIQLSVDHTQLRTVVHAAEEFVDYVAIQITDDALEVNFSGPSNVVQISATIPITEWRTPPRTGEIVLDTEDFKEKLWGIGIGDTKLRADAEKNRFAVMDCAFPYEIETAGEDSKPFSPSADITRKLTTRARLPGYQLAAGVAGASAASDLNVGIAIHDDRIIFGGHRRDEEDYVTRLEFDAETTGPNAAAVYSESFLSKIARHIPEEGITELQLRNGFPVQFDAGYIRFGLAPRATDEDDTEHPSNLTAAGGEQG